MTTQQLTEIFKAARAAAMAQSNGDDGGTCNFDSATFEPRSIRLSDAEILQAASAAGVHAHFGKWMKSNTCWVCCSQGQANRRTRMAEAFNSSLKASGIKACMYYQMD